MNPAAFAVAVFLLAASLAGCLGASQPPAAFAAAPSEPGQAQGVVEVAVDAIITTPGLFFADQVECYANGTCVYYGTETVYMVGGWNGTTIDSGHVYYYPDGSAEVIGTQTFTGSLEGCGQGSLTFDYHGTGSALAVPNDHGWVPGSENLTLIPGSQTTGFAGMLDARIEEDFNISLVDYAASGTARGIALCKPADVPAPPSHDGAQRIEMSLPVTSPGSPKVEIVDCAQENPQACGEAYGTELVDFTGDWNGTMIDHFHYHYLPNGSAVYSAFRFFTGSIAGCGSGTFAAWGGGTVDAEPDPGAPGYQDIHDRMVLAPGSTTTGFEGLVDMQASAEGFINMATFSGYGTFAATVWCRAPPFPVGSPVAVEIDQTFTSPGMHIVPDALSCDPAVPDVCELQNTQLFFLEGRMTGTMLDINRVRFNPDGSIVERAERIFAGSIGGCGSGTLTLQIRGTAPPVAPDLARPGYIAIREAPMVLVPGATSLGFAGLREGTITDQGDFHGDVAVGEGDATISGTFWCVPPGEAPVGSFANEAGPRDAPPPSERVLDRVLREFVAV